MNLILAAALLLQAAPDKAPDPEIERKSFKVAPGFEVALHQSYPNPFNAATVISYQLDQHRRVALVVYDLTGQVVRHLVAESQPPGGHRVTWDGHDDGGRPVATGVYLYQLTIDELRLVRKMVRVR